jgi:hypothetical protein
MPTHWTYEQDTKHDRLCQGDVLARTEELLSLLGDVHAHFCDEKYRGFMILSQTCDLVRRDGRCKARHIALAVIRSLSDIIAQVFASEFGRLARGLYSADRRRSAEQLLERIVNQNEQASGLFYLHPDADAEISGYSVAILPVSIALRSEHYDLLLRSKRAQLRPEFQAKLGWMVGSIYSRIGVPDWKESEGEAKERDLINRILTFDSDLHEPLWVAEKAFRKALRKHPHLDELPEAQLVELIKQNSPPSGKELAIASVKREIAAALRSEADRALGLVRDAESAASSDEDIEAELLRRVVSRLTNSVEFDNSLRRCAKDLRRSTS